MNLSNKFGPILWGVFSIKKKTVRGKHNIILVFFYNISLSSLSVTIPVYELNLFKVLTKS